MKDNGQTAVVRRRQTKALPGGKTIELGQLVFKDFAQIRVEACSRYKRNLIETYTKNLDLVPEQLRGGIVMQAFEKAEKITPDDLPPKKAWLPKRNGEGKILRHAGQRFYHDDAHVWIENGGPLLEEQAIEYANWWMSYSPDGQVYAAWLSARKCPGQESLSLDDIDHMFVDAAEALDDVANTIGELSEPQLGNAEAPAMPAQTGR